MVPMSELEPRTQAGGDHVVPFCEAKVSPMRSRAASAAERLASVRASATSTCIPVPYTERATRALPFLADGGLAG
jgi:hypothetical protein